MKTLDLGSVFKTLGKRRIYVAAAIFAICMFLSVGASGQGNNQNANKGNPTPTPNPIATIYDYDPLRTTLMLMRSDGPSGGDQATYASPLSSFVSGEWSLNLSNQTQRMVYITPNVGINNQQPQGPSAGYYWQGVSSRTGCFDQSGNIVPLATVVTASGNCKLGINFDSGGTRYKLLMSPFPLSGSGDPPPTCPTGGCPATGAVKVTCNGVSNNQCRNWTIEPNVTAANANVANLYRYASVRGKATWVFIGQYYNSFRINVSLP